MKNRDLNSLRLSELTSELKKDFLILIQFDDYVLSHIENPIIFSFLYNGKNVCFSPDYKVIFKSDKNIISRLKPIIVQIIHSRDLKRNAVILNNIIQAGENYAQKNDLEFKILTEKNIRTPFLFNAKFFRNYMNYEVNHPEDIDLIISTIKAFGITCPWKAVLYAVSEKAKQSELLNIIWHLIAIGYIKCDFNEKINIRSDIWIGN